MGPSGHTGERTIGVERRVLARLAAACLFLCALMTAIAARWEMREHAVRTEMAAAARTTSLTEENAARERARARLGPRTPTAELAIMGAQLALSEAPADFTEAEQRTLQALNHAPTRPDAWAQLARIRAERANAMTPDALNALQYSFDVAPFGDGDLQRRRLLLALAYWEAVNPRLQRAVMRQVSALWTEETDREWLRALLARTQPGPARDALATALARADFAS